MENCHILRGYGAFAPHIRRLQRQHGLDLVPAPVADLAAQGGFVRLQPGHVSGNQGLHLGAQGGGGFQPQQHLLCQLCSHGGVAVEVAPSVFIQGKGGHLADVVEQRRPPQRQFRRHRPHHMGYVGEQIIGEWPRPFSSRVKVGTLPMSWSSAAHRSGSSGGTAPTTWATWVNKS